MKSLAAVVFVLAALPTTVFAQSPTASPAPAAARPAASPLRSVNHTFYTNRSEIFAEWRPFIVGQPTRFSVHSTKVGEHFKAYTQGIVVATLSGTGEELTSTAEKPERAGVFRLNFTPTKPGTAKVAFTLTDDGPAEHFVIDNVPVYATTEDALAHQPPAEDTGMIRFSKETQWDMDFATAVVGSKMTVPASAIVTQNGGSYVYVQFNPERFELKPVQVKTNQDGSVKITSGVRSTDRIVVRGAETMPRK